MRLLHGKPLWLKTDTLFGLDPIERRLGTKEEGSISNCGRGGHTISKFVPREHLELIGRTNDCAVPAVIAEINSVSRCDGRGQVLSFKAVFPDVLPRFRVCATDHATASDLKEATINEEGARLTGVPLLAIPKGV
jgi:hypothetical protein